MNCIARYVVKEIPSGKVIASGSSNECARKMGITYGSFLTIASRSRRGIGKRYIVERLNDMPWQKECAQKWDAAFGWYRVSRVKYPCDGCMRRALCEFTDTYCPRWAEWFRAAHDAAAATLKARGGAG